jgi:hypothetical protein
MPVRLVLLAFAFAGSNAAEAQALFKCVGRDGKVTYQSEKCADAVRESTVRPPDPVAPRVAPQADGTEPKANERKDAASAEPPIDLNVIIGHISSYENCAATVPGFGAKHNANYARWKERHRTAIARFNQDGEAQRRVRDSIQYVRGRMSTRSAEERQYENERCETTVAATFAPPTPATSPPTKN